MNTAPRSSLMHRYLDPASSLGEIIFGLIMTLTFTLGAGIIIDEEGREGVRELLIAIIGCNIAWGLIDAAMYLVGQLFDRGRKRRVGASVRGAPDEAAATAIVESELDTWFDDVMTVPERQALYKRVVAIVRNKPGAAGSITKADFMGAFTSFWLVVLASAPAAIPFLVMDDARLALRVSNGILLVLLFATGFFWSKYTLSKPWIVGFSFLLVGLALVAAAIALGG